MVNEVKLPKQWRHWCADQKLKIHGGKRGRWQWLYLKVRATTGASTATGCSSVATPMQTLIGGRYAP